MTNATIRIAGLDFEVARVNPSRALDHNNYGRFELEKQVITIDGSVRDEMQRKTLFHELIHAADILYGVNDVTEAQVLSLENGLWAIFNDNPGLARGIFGDRA